MKSRANILSQSYSDPTPRNSPRPSRKDSEFDLIYSGSLPEYEKLLIAIVHSDTAKWLNIKERLPLVLKIAHLADLMKEV